MKQVFLSILFLLVISSGAHGQAETLKLWPGKAPGETGEIGAEEVTKPGAAGGVKRMTNVTEPRIEIYPAPEGKNTGTAVVVCPGGGYNILAFDHEGRQVVEWLHGIGVSGILLKYRVPRRDGREKHEAPLEDAQRAMGMVRKDAEKWGIDPGRVGMLGFSAGGHLALTAGTNFEERAYARVDDADDLSCRPDFLIPVYPAYLVEEGDGGKLAPEIVVTEKTPPMFFAHADNDPHSAEGSALVYIALKRAGVPGELHIYADGGHGFGMLKRKGKPISTWPDRCAEWMRAMGFLDAE